MAAFYGVNYNATYVLKGKYKVGEYNGHVKCLFDEITLASEVTAADTISIGKLPQGARVKNVRVKSEALSAGAFSAGHTGYVASSQNGSVAKAAATAGFLAATSYAAAGQTDGVGADIGFKFLSETEVQLVCTTTTTVGLGKKIQCWVDYIVD